MMPFAVAGVDVEFITRDAEVCDLLFTAGEREDLSDIGLGENVFVNGIPGGPKPLRP